MTSEERDGDTATPGPERESASPAQPVRRFGDAEIARILKAASEMQARSGADASNPARGLTLAEIRQVAQEAGIDPRFVDLAATSAGGPEERRMAALTGGAHSWRFQTEVPAELGDEDRARILHAIRSVIGQKGEIGDVFGRMEWSHDDGMGPVIVGITSRAGMTAIDVSATRSTEMSLFHGVGIPMGGILGGLALSSGLGLAGALALPVVAATTATAYGIARLGWRARAAWWERRLRAVLERAASVVREAGSRP